MDLKGLEIQNFDYLFLKFEKYFENYTEVKDAKKDVLNNTQPWNVL